MFHRVRTIKSINQSNFYSANISSKVRLSGATAKSVFNSKIGEAVQWHQRATGHAGVHGVKAKSKRCDFRCFLKAATEMAERTDSGRLFQREGIYNLFYATDFHRSMATTSLLAFKLIRVQT